MTESGIPPIVAGIARTEGADYVLVALGADDDHEWLTSRLFLLAAILERTRLVRSLVFTGEGGAFVGAASPRDVRNEIGALFPQYERALGRAYGSAAGLSLSEFARGRLSEAAVNAIANAFLSQIGPGGSSFIVSIAPPAEPNGWVFLDRSGEVPPGQSSWEDAEWVTSRGLAQVLQARMSRGAVTATPGAQRAKI